MPQGLVFLLAGACAYAACNQWLAACRPGAQVRLHLLMSLLVLAAAAAGIAYAGTLNPSSPQQLLLGGAFVIGCGILAWGLVPWVIGLQQELHAPLALTALSSAWALLFTANLFAQPSLLYAGWRPLQASSLSFEAVINPWWWAIPVLCVLSLLYCSHALYRRYRSDAHQALRLAPPLALLCCGLIWDSLVQTQILHGYQLSIPLLMLSAVYWSLVLARPVRAQHTAAQATVNRPELLPRWRSVAERLPDIPASIVQPAPISAPKRGAPLQLSQLESHPMAPSTAAWLQQHIAQPSAASTGDEAPMPASCPLPSARANPRAVAVDQGDAQDPVRQGLHDIAVYNKILLHRLQDEELDPRALQVLSRHLQELVEETRAALQDSTPKSPDT